MLTGSGGLIEAQIKDWVRRHVCAVSKEYGRCKKVMLRHLNIERKPTGDVHTVNIATDPANEGTEIADRVINEIADAALRDANDMKAGVQTYGLYAYYTNDPNYAPRKIFRAAAADDEFSPESGPSEPPNEKGLVAQLMRHNEINSKNSLVAMGYIIQTFQKEIEQQRAMNQKFMDQQVENALILQEVMNDAHKRRLEEKKTELEMSVVEGVFEHLKVVLPIVANKIAGKDIVPSAMPRELYLFASLLENLTEQQQTVLRDMLNPQQVALLAELLGVYEKKKSKLLGEKPPEEEEAEPEKKNGDPKTLTKKPPNRLASLFERRSVLVNKDTRLEIKDEVTRRLEERVERQKQKLAEIRSTTEPKKTE